MAKVDVPRKKRGPGHPITTRASEVPRISYSVSKAQHQELEREARTLPKRAGKHVSASIAAKRRAFPEEP